MTALIGEEADKLLKDLQEKDTEIAQSKAEIAQLKEHASYLEQQLAYFKQQLYGHKSEKTRTIMDDGQINLFNEAETETTIPEKEKSATITVKEHKRKKQVGQLEEKLKELPVEEIVHEPEEKDLVCPKCGSRMQPLAKVLVRQEVRHIPARLILVKHYRQSYKCLECPKDAPAQIVTGTAPNPPLAHSYASPSLLAEVLTQKYSYALPLYRQAKQLAELGLPMDTTTLANWVIKASQDWLEPLVELMHKHLLAEHYLHADETSVQVLQEKKRSGKSVSWMWCFATGSFGTSCAIRIFRYGPGRAGRNARDYLDGFSGYLHTDGYSGYNRVTGVTRCSCWAHVRRYFKAADPKLLTEGENLLSAQSIQQINKLFEIEKELAELSAAERKSQRLAKEKPLLEAFFAWAEENMGKVPAKSSLGKAFGYARSNRKFLENYLQDGNCNISNNLIENSIRPFTVGRKNWLFSTSPRGADASSTAYSIIETCKVNDINPYKYLVYIFTMLPNTPFLRKPELLEDFLPWSKQIQELCR